jgi:mono/diheme cytochrome c family protein
MISTHSLHRILLKKILPSIFVFFLSSAAIAADGKKVFDQNCKTCHTLTDQTLTGPGLAGVTDRVPSDQWMKDWIKNSSAMVKAGDPYAVKVFNQFNKSAMTVFDGVLSEEEIDAVIAYIKNPPPDPSKKTETVSAGDEGGEAPKSSASKYYLWFTIFVLAVLVFSLRSTKRNLQNAVHRKKGLAPLPEYTIKEWMQHNKRTVALICIVLFFAGSKWGWDSLMAIGVYKDYQPSQPIEFSHKVHAGDMGINCEYCHSGASKSKVAGVPSANVCMNCHKAVSSGTMTGEKEIAKIYAAVGYNPKTQQYDQPSKPIEWVRVHTLPDFVFFSHQQHVVVGKQDCKNCHGDMEKKGVAHQENILTMGWCIDCHRKTAVPGMGENPYYEELHKKLAEMYKGQAITVDKMGGIECGKCHY